MKDDDKVIEFPKKRDYANADDVLEQAIGDYKDVLILGYNHNGEFMARATTMFADGGDILWIMERFKFGLLAGDYSND
jgi:hypothetical protein